jgi:hypothetical protein
MTRRTDADVISDDGHSRPIQAAFRCDECGFWSIGLADQDSRWQAEYFDGGDFLDNRAEIVWLPLHGTSKEFPDVPEHVAAPASEAHECRSITANRAAVLLARAVIEATAKEKGITTGPLAAKIDQLGDQGYIRDHVSEAAHEARHLGNDMAHGDFGEPVDAEGADEVLVIMDEILVEVFQGLPEQSDFGSSGRP